jgi:hypothetical protein
LSDQTVTLSQLESHLWESANILRGPVDAADFKTYIFPLLFFKRICDVWDEEYDEIVDETGDAELALFPESHRFQIPDDCHWNDVRAVATNVGNALQRAMREIEKANPDTLYGVFGDAQWACTVLLSVHIKDMAMLRLEFEGSTLKRRVGNPNIHMVLEYAKATGVVRTLVRGGAKYQQMLVEAFAEHVLGVKANAHRIKSPTLDLSMLRTGFEVPEAFDDGFSMVQLKALTLLSPDSALKIECTAMQSSQQRSVHELLKEKLPGPLEGQWAVTAAQVNLYYPPDPGRTRAKVVTGHHRGDQQGAAQPAQVRRQDAGAVGRLSGCGWHLAEGPDPERPRNAAGNRCGRFDSGDRGLTDGGARRLGLDLPPVRGRYARAARHVVAARGGDAVRPR